MSDIGSFFGSVGQAAGGGLIGAGINAINQAINYKYATKMADYNFGLNEKAADAADARRRALYADFESPMAKIRQLKEAGLSPSLYAGGELGGGIGSTAGAQGGGGAGGSIPSSAASVPDLATMETQKAQARLLNAEADKLEGKNFAGQLDAVKVFSEAGLNNAATRYQEAQTTLANIQVKYADENAKLSLRKLQYDTEEARNNASKSFWEAESSNLQWKFELETFELRKQELANTAVEIAARTALEKSQTRLNDEERQHIAEFAKAALDGAKAHADTAESYGEYVEAMADNMQKQIEMRQKELNVEKWKIGVGAVTSVLQGGAFLLGGGFFSGAAKAVVKGL